MASPLDDVRGYLERLSQRDRNLLALLALVVGLFAILMAGTGLSRAASKRLSRIESKQKSLREVVQLTAGYRQAEQQRQDVERKLKGSAQRNLFSYLEDLGKKDGLEIGSMNDKGSAPAGDDKDSKIMQSSVEVTLTHVQLDKLTKFLNDVENNPGMVRVTRLQVRPRDDDAVLDAWFTVSTYYMGS